MCCGYGNNYYFIKISEKMNINRLNAFLKNNEQAGKELDKANKLLARVREELSFCRNQENKLRLQLTKAQDRSVLLQRHLNAFQSATEKSCQQQKDLNRQEKEITELEKMVAELKSAVLIKVAAVTKETQLMCQVAELKKQISENDAQSQLSRIEQQMALKNKEIENKQLEEKLEDTTRNLEKTQLDYDMIKNELDRIHLTYSKQIMNYEATIRRYEKERQEILGDNVGPRGGESLKVDNSRTSELWDKKVNITWADAARKVATEGGSVSYSAPSIPDNKNKMSASRMPIQKRQSSTFQPKTKLSVAVRPTVVPQTAPPLEVVSKAGDDQQPKRKKLYSSNSNHFFIDME